MAVAPLEGRRQMPLQVHGLMPAARCGQSEALSQASVQPPTIIESDVSHADGTMHLPAFVESQGSAAFTHTRWPLTSMQPQPLGQSAPVVHTLVQYFGPLAQAY